MRKTTIAILSVLLGWFTLVIPGVSIGDFVLVVSAFGDEPIDIVFWAIYLLIFVCFIWRDKIGKYIMAFFLTGWAFIQGTVYFRTGERLASYYEHFAYQGTHRILPTYDGFLVKDTYHIVLDLLILVALACTILCCIKTRKRS